MEQAPPTLIHGTLLPHGGQQGDRPAAMASSLSSPAPPLLQPASSAQRATPPSRQRPQIESPFLCSSPSPLRALAGCHSSSGLQLPLAASLGRRSSRATPLSPWTTIKSLWPSPLALPSPMAWLPPWMKPQFAGLLSSSPSSSSAIPSPWRDAYARLPLPAAQHLATKSSMQPHNIDAS